MVSGCHLPSRETDRCRSGPIDQNDGDEYSLQSATAAIVQARGQHDLLRYLRTHTLCSISKSIFLRTYSFLRTYFSQVAVMNEISLGRVAIVVGGMEGWQYWTVSTAQWSPFPSVILSFLPSFIASVAMRARVEASCPLHGPGADAVAVDAAAALSAGHRSSLASLPAGESDCIASRWDEISGAIGWKTDKFTSPEWKDRPPDRTRWLHPLSWPHLIVGTHVCIHLRGPMIVPMERLGCRDGCSIL